MDRREYFEQMQAHLDAGGTVTPPQRAQLRRWQSKPRHPGVLSTAYDIDETADFAEYPGEEHDLV